VRGTLPHGRVGYAEIPVIHLARYAGGPFAQIMRSRINDFAIKLANVNGTGSASANSLIMQAIFRMGVPVSGKNLFPSNIQGLPTWYEIRVNRMGYTARALDYDLMVAMNSQTYARDVARFAPAAICSTIRRGRSTRSCIATTSLSSACRWRALQRELPRAARAHSDEEHRHRRAR
jgi:hypothetical protein